MIRRRARSATGAEEMVRFIIMNGFHFDLINMNPV
jgi:hypothetical protein